MDVSNRHSIAELQERQKQTNDAYLFSQSADHHLHPAELDGSQHWDGGWTSRVVWCSSGSTTTTSKACRPWKSNGARRRDRC